MNNLWLILDSDFLCHKAKHVFKSLAFDGQPTGILFGFLKDLEIFQEEFSPYSFVFCWDTGHGLRESMYPIYKANRRKNEYTESEIEFENFFRKQMKLLREKYLQEVGFQNIFWQDGYESDDLIAKVCETVTKQQDRAIIISADHDLYQLLTDDIQIYNPSSKKKLNQKSFEDEYGITPKQWVTVKCLAGCSTDNIKGIKGVGEKTAIKFLKHELNPDSATYAKIILEKDSILETNRPLIGLPLDGTNEIELTQDAVSKKEWRSLCRRYGMRTLE